MNLTRFLIVMCMVSPAMAQTPSISFTETFEIGSDIDLNQGFYVCKSNPRDLMARLMEIKQPINRRSTASVAGCPFQMTNKEGPKYKVLEEVGTICGDQKIVYDKDIKGRRVATRICGNEGHQLIVEHNGQQVIVLMLTSDVDYD